MLWLGGMFFLGIVGAPVLRNIEPPPSRRNEHGVSFPGWHFGIAPSGFRMSIVRRRRAPIRIGAP